MSDSCGLQTELMNMETAHHHEEDKMRVLYEASYKGCVSTLNSLLQEDPGLLYKISSQTIFIETPLHISASHGHLEFTKTLLAHKPELALERNSSQSTPLHFASAEGHIDIVKQLLEAREEACLVRDHDGRTPLHYAVIRGRRDVVLKLIRAKPESLKTLDDVGKTIFHFCVTYNQLEILKDLVKLDTHGTHELLTKGDLDGKNTILHLAITLKQVETVNYLISIPEIRSEALNFKNDMGYTAPDTVQRIPKDSKSLEIQVILMESGIKCGMKKRVNVVSIEDGRWWWQWRRKVLKIIDKWLKYNGDWVEDMRGNLSLVATVVATITFQAALNPPGSVIQQGIVTSSSGSVSNASTQPQGLLTCMPSFKDPCGDIVVDPGPCPGEAMFGYVYPVEFRNFITFNTISFVASLCVALLLVSGVPLKHRFVLWMLSIGMVITLTCLLSAYFVGVSLITPSGIYDEETVVTATMIFMGLNALVGIYMVTIFVIWVVTKLKDKLPMVKKLKDKFTKHRKSTGQGTGTDTTNNA